MKRRGEIWWVNFDPSVGQEIRKKRPAVIVSNDVSNHNLRRYQVISLSTQTNRLYANEVFIRFGKNGSKAMADQLTTVSELRFLDKAGMVSSAEMSEIERIIKTQLDLK